ncbi:hypothetical protein GLW07_18935 [Bacillus hwajinpoensis]|uniref:HNH endonuclease n=1 Tax=Guptibacillus hwajinpoensis TaxID=208199 RepID=A0A845F3W7_9BACL|nr:hypothetical protein [Pseudalkalibacillus hwajinpoensis]MYL65438.1 hypothetical protein [Pseudalkalibacillus hwajinpoensis]
MLEIKKTKKLKLMELHKDGELIQKLCRTCEVFKAPEEFYRKTEGYLRADCKECHRKIQNEYNRKIRDRRIVQNQNSRARKLWLDDTFTIEEYKELEKVANGSCMISGKKSNALQIDHVQAISKQWLGSTKGNLILVSDKVNNAKRDLSIFEFIESERSEGLVDKKQLKKTMEYLAEMNKMNLTQYINFLQEMEEYAKKSKDFFGR